VTEGRSDIDPAANAFDGAAADYERARPSYPPESIEVLRRELGVGPGTRVCDLAAGTGKLTRLLVGIGAEVVAVEPVAGMRSQLREVLPDIDVLDGTAESIPLPDESVDAVTVAQAFHWFDFDAALEEIHRIVKPNGAVAILFNERDDREPWVAGMSDVLHWHERNSSQYQRTDWAAVLGGHGFSFTGDARVQWNQPMTRDLLESRVRSVSYVAKEPADVQQDYVDRVLALVDDFPETFDLPYITRVWWATRT